MQDDGGETKKEQEVIDRKIDIYNDVRLEDPNFVLETEITCSHFIEAVEKNVYGFHWECPNNGDKCQYKHALPKGYILDRDRAPLEEPTDERPIEEIIEEERMNLPSEGLTPITFESFMAWKKKKQEEKEQAL